MIRLNAVMQLQSDFSKPFQEKHYTVNELAQFWRLSPDTIRRIFSREFGVIHIAKQNSKKRRFISLRIPESVAERVWNRLKNVA